MNSISMSVVAIVLLMGLVSALPNELSAALTNKPDTSLPQNTMMGQTLKDLDIEICQDNVHLCPGTLNAVRKKMGSMIAAPKLLFQLQEIVATNWDSSGLAVPHLCQNATGGDAGGHKYFKHGL
ncbi:uncharacterized protein TNCT_44091 [Trichonephila clavata]|uniref:Uncharacterized protein n=1 Tax=Trichonephila clavata TaxID=2740835 RepID=A0A8X6L9D8_TRICU|nr:uncharacterized protein TNCT_44091 [Trichonephila clavata]